MRLRFLPIATLTLLLPATVLSAPASAQAALSISVSPTSARMGESVTVTGTSDCADVAYTVRFHFTDQNGDPATTTATGTTDASGEFTQAITVPESSVAGEDASIDATAACSGGEQTSNEVPFEITTYEGTLTIDPRTGESGDAISVSGDTCYGGDIVVVFTDGESAEEVPVTLNPDRTFSGTYILPDAPGGDYFFDAECPGSDFAEVAFVLVNDAPPPPAPTPSVSPTPGPVPTPVPGPVDYTG